MAGCDKAGRNKKSPSNANYKNTNKLAINKKRNETTAKRQAEVVAQRAARRAAEGKPVRGSARVKRRAAAQAMIGADAPSFQEAWAKYRKLEAERPKA
jgi:hypothetical protein